MVEAMQIIPPAFAGLFVEASDIDPYPAVA